ncbi:hypothetical protein CEXT_707081 [Caerostris extrusa]|uniref:Uncharacterized protein n=1 Tax=Caerostris extrusa TaxID=172846 RepID=A0AAV4TYP1_CAEEX|nr:hypothetical protein CEXT_707081 [Caerostris extrusa]
MHSVHSKLHTTIPGINLTKAGLLTVQLNSETSAMIAQRYPSEEWIDVHRDGSQKSETCSAELFSSVAQGSIAVG